MAARALTFKEFADLQGWRPSYVTKLRKAGRLVLSAEGRVKVRESLELIAQTAGNRGDVAKRHQAAREEHATAAGEEKNAVESAAPSGKGEKRRRVREDAGEDAMREAMKQKALAESRRVIALADREEMERDRLAGDLIAREDVDAAMKFIGATVRGLLDVFPDQTAPLVIGVKDMDECHAVLTESCRNVLIDLGQVIEKQIAAIGKVDA